MAVKPAGTCISNAGVAVPRLLYGTAWKGERTAALVRAALLAGFRGLDTACQPKHYAEDGVGAGLAAAETLGLARESLYVQTKYTPATGQDPRRLPYHPAASIAQQVAQSFAVSCANLGCQRLDGLLLHAPFANRRDTLAAWRAMEALVGEGGVRQIGISNCYATAEFDALYRAAEIKPALLQNRFYAKTRYDRELRARCRADGIIYQSFWTLTANPHILSGATVATIAAHHRRSPAQVLFRYLTQIDVVPLSGTCSDAHMQDDLAIFEFQLSAREIEAMGLLF